MALDRTKKQGFNPSALPPGLGIAALVCAGPERRIVNVCLRPDRHEKRRNFSALSSRPLRACVWRRQQPVSRPMYRMPQNDGANCLHSGPGTLGRSVSGRCISVGQ